MSYPHSSAPSMHGTLLHGPAAPQGLPDTSALPTHHTTPFHQLLQILSGVGRVLTPLVCPYSMPLSILLH